MVHNKLVSLSSSDVSSHLVAGKLLVRVLVSGVGIAALLVIAFGVIPQSRR